MIRIDVVLVEAPLLSLVVMEAPSGPLWNRTFCACVNFRYLDKQQKGMTAARDLDLANPLALCDLSIPHRQMRALVLRVAQGRWRVAH